jgi:6,7-dimethyl-8-ribityllumazine synthase
MSTSSPPAARPALTPAPRLAILVSRFNTAVTGGLREGALAWLQENGIKDPDVFEAPGAFELPLMAQSLARTRRYEGIICLGCVIKGDTAHFEFISLGATIGLMQAQLQTGVPMAFGVLTTYGEEQAIARSRNDAHNKGREAAAACVEALAFLRQTARLT